jgi:ferritin-like metal-binding protein YciE
MKIESLRSLFVEELEDAYDFEHQIVDALPKMVEAASDPELQKGFRQHLEQTEDQIERLEEVFREIGEEPSRKTCKGMKGLLAEGEEVVEAKGDDAAKDAALIGAAQRVEHYEMAAYGTLSAFARTLGHTKSARILDRILEQESKTDERLSKLAESRINPRAAGDGAAPRKGRETASRSTNGSGGLTREELYGRAQELGVEGRSKMSKDELRRAVERA